MPAVAKNLSALGVLYTDRRDFYVSPQEVKELWTDLAPFTTIVSNRQIRAVPDPDFKMFEHRSGWIEQSFFANESSSAPSWTSTGAPGDYFTSLDIDNIKGLNNTVDSTYVGLILEYWDVSKTTYKGLLLVYASSTTLSCKAIGNPRAANNICAALADNDVFYVVGTAFGEGTSAPDGFSDELEVVYNSSQIFKTAVQVTGTLYAAALRGYSSELERLRMEKNKEHKIQKERAFLFGTRSGGTGMTDLALDNSTSDAHASSAHNTDTDGNTVRTCMGLVPAIYRYGTSTGDKQNIFSINSGTYAYSNFVDDMEKVFQYIPDSGFKYALCGVGAMSYWSKVDAVNGFVKKSGMSVNLDSNSRDALGFNFRRLITPHGELHLVYAPILRGPYRSSMLVIDDANLFLAQYRAPKFQTNIKTDNAFDGVKDMWFSDEGIGITLIERHSIWNIA